MNARWTIISLLALAAHTPVSARTAEPSRAVVHYSDLDLRTKAGAAALRARLDFEVVALSGGDGWSDRPELVAARKVARAQADALIAAALDSKTAPVAVVRS